MNKFFIFFIFLFLTFFISANENSTLDVQKQLDMDLTLVPMGKGALFVPYIINPDIEPPFLVYQDGYVVAEGYPGVRLPLNPGKYSVEIGANPETNMVFDVEIFLEKVTVVPVLWSALVVNIYDSFGNPLRLGYGIAEEETKLVVGSALSSDETRGEKPFVWILKPGLYRIFKKGESTDSFKNFVTVRTVAANSSIISLYFDENTNQLAGGGETADSAIAFRKKGDWSFKALFSALFSLMNTGTLEEKNETTYYNFGSRFNGSVVYDKEKLLFSNKLDSYESFIRKNNERFLTTIDIAKFQSLAFYRLTKNFGPYAALFVRTRLFNNYKELSSSASEIRTVENDGKESIYSAEKPFLVSKAFSPTVFRESAGFNYEFKLMNKLVFSTRLGWALKQNYAPYLYDDSKDLSSTPEKDLYRIKKFQMSQGPELSLYFSFMPFDFFEIKEDLLGMYDLSSKNGFSYSSESSAALWLSRFANIQYSFWIERDKTIAENTYKYHTLSMQLFYRVY